MSHRQDYDQVAIIAVQGNVAAIPELNEPFPKFWSHVLGGAADLRMHCERRHALPNRLRGASRGARIL